MTPKQNKKKISPGKYCQQTWAKTQVSARLLLGLDISPSYFRRVEGCRKGFHSCNCARNFSVSLNQNSPLTALCIETVQMWAAVPSLRQQEEENYSISVYLLWVWASFLDSFLFWANTNDHAKCRLKDVISIPGKMMMCIIKVKTSEYVNKHQLIQELLLYLSAA